MHDMFWGYLDEVVDAHDVPPGRKVRALLLDVMDNAVVQARRYRTNLVGYSAYQAALADEALARLTRIMDAELRR